MKVFVTGASGFIGAHVTRALCARGHSVVALVLPVDSLFRLKDETGKFTVVTGQLSDTDTLYQALHKFRPEACLHLAWFAAPHEYLSSPQNISSLTDSLALLNGLIQAGCRQVVMAGTCAEYDTNFGYLQEESANRPTTLYGATKLSCCLISQKIAALAQIDFAWARIFFPYGPQENKQRVVPSAIRALLRGKPFPATEGEYIRDYIFVEDVADAFCTILEKKAKGIFNISSGQPVTIRQLLELIGSLIGNSDLIKFGALSYRDWDPPFICGDNRRLKALGWKPRYTLNQGLQKSIQWWQLNDSDHD